MHKKICGEFVSKITVVTIMLFAFPNLIGMRYWTRGGWNEPDVYIGIYLSVASLIIYIHYKKYCREPIVYICADCKEVFDGSNLKNLICPNCGSKKLLPVDEYYKNTIYDDDSLGGYLKEIILFVLISFPIYYIIHIVASTIFT